MHLFCRKRPLSFNRIGEFVLNCSYVLCRVFVDDGADVSEADVVSTFKIKVPTGKVSKQCFKLWSHF
jgi:hypothetical protein